jgi:hypothetical protein
MNSPEQPTDAEQPTAADPRSALERTSNLLLEGAPDGVTLEIAASALRERIYGSIACLSTLLVITGSEHLDRPWSTALDVLTSTGGLWTASVLAELIAHLGAHRSTPGLREVRHISWVSGQIMAASAVPLALIVLAGFDVMSLHAAVWSAVWTLVAEMGIFASLAVRSTSLKWWGKSILIASLVVLGLLVVFLKTLAH